jgi:hypothetical protein
MPVDDCNVRTDESANDLIQISCPVDFGGVTTPNAPVVAIGKVGRLTYFKSNER